MAEKPKPVCLTPKLNEMLDDAAGEAGLAKEGLAHAIFLLVLTDPAAIERACRMTRYLGNQGATTLAGRDL